MKELTRVSKKVKQEIERKVDQYLFEYYEEKVTLDVTQEHQNNIPSHIMDLFSDLFEGNKEEETDYTVLKAEWVSLGKITVLQFEIPQSHRQEHGLDYNLDRIYVYRCTNCNEVLPVLEGMEEAPGEQCECGWTFGAANCGYQNENQLLVEGLTIEELS
jgi:hypothetical protein